MESLNITLGFGVSLAGGYPPELHLLDQGVSIKVSPVDQDSVAILPSSVSGVLFNFLRPDDTILTVSPSGVGSVFQYATRPGDISLIGAWRLQVSMTQAAGMIHSEIANFRVLPNLI